MGIPVGFHFRIVARIIGYQEQVLGRDVHPETLHIYFLQGLLRKTVSQYNILQPNEGTVFYQQAINIGSILGTPGPYTRDKGLWVIRARGVRNGDITGGKG